MCRGDATSEISKVYLDSTFNERGLMNIINNDILSQDEAALWSQQDNPANHSNLVSSGVAPAAVKMNS